MGFKVFDSKIPLIAVTVNPAVLGGQLFKIGKYFIIGRR